MRDHVHVIYHYQITVQPPGPSPLSPQRGKRVIYPNRLDERKTRMLIVFLWWFTLFVSKHEDTTGRAAGQSLKFSITGFRIAGTPTHTHPTHTHTVLLYPSPSHIHQEVCWWGRGPSGSGLYVLYYMCTTATAHKRFAQAWAERPWCRAADPAKTKFCLKSVIHHVWICGSGYCGNGR